MTTPLVSIVTPCYNTGAFLHLPIASVLAQTYPHYEMIIVDDGSTDPATLAALAAINQPHIRVHRQANRGLAGARNGGIQVARGTYILPLDADDQITPDCLSLSVDCLEAHPEVAMVYGNVEYFGDEQRLVVTPRFNPYRALYANCFVVSSLFRRSAWEEVGGYTETMLGFEDWEFWLKLIERGHTFAKIDATLFRYHKRYASDYYGTLKIYRQVVAQIRALHPRLYTPENRRRLKREYGVGWIEDLWCRVPVPWRDRVNRAPTVRRMKECLRCLINH